MYPPVTEEKASQIIATLTQAGFETRFVGGCVRDALLDRPVQDIDLATTALPQEVTKILQDAGLKVVPTGVDFGTVTAVLDGKGYEITTLRRDIETDGRHAKVQYTKDWREDAARRDFTFNALSRDGAGAVYDYFNGIEDARLGRVRFVGDAAARVAEDYLRLLRYFRFYAWYAHQSADEDTLSIVQGAAPHLQSLSRERIWKEFSKLLAAPDPSESVMLMLKHNIMPFVLEGADDLATMCSLISYERMRKKQSPPNALLRLAALLTGKKITAAEVQNRFALSSADTQKLDQYLHNPLVFERQFAASNLSFCLYRYGFDLTEDFLVLAQAQAAHFHWESARPVLEKWVPKFFPLSGADVMALGLAAGPRVGQILSAVEAWWMEENFVPDHAACLEKAKAMMESGE